MCPSHLKAGLFVILPNQGSDDTQELAWWTQDPRCVTLLL